jgi:hypothetical protein
MAEADVELVLALSHRWQALQVFGTRSTCGNVSLATFLALAFEGTEQLCPGSSDWAFRAHRMRCQIQALDPFIDLGNGRGQSLWIVALD